jgi:tetratricopeptide (TPR) repeat protein
VLNPVAVVGHMLRVPGEYVVLVAVSALLAFAQGVVGVVAGAVGRTGIPFFSGWIATTLMLYVPFVWARAMGLLLFVRGDRLGYGRAEDYLEPALGDTRPRGGEVDIGPDAAKAKTGDTDSTASRAAGSPDAERSVSPVFAPAAMGALAEVESAPQDPAAWAAAIEHALGRGDMPAAVEAYRKTPEGVAVPVPPHDLLEIGRAAASQGDYPLAARALRAAGESDPADPAAPRALVVLARVYAERLNDAAAALEVYRAVVARYPNTEAARYAQARLDEARV